MKSHFLSSRPIKAGALSLAAAASLAVGCSNDGGKGDGNYDDSIAPGGSSSAGRRGSSAGAPSTSAGATNQSAVGGSYGAAGAHGGAAGSGGVGGSAGTSASAGMSGHAGTSGSAGMNASAGMSAGGSMAGGGTTNSCGNGIVDSGEACDSGMPNTGSAGTAGSGTTGTGGDDQSGGGAPSAVPKYGQICSNTCSKVGNQACLDCEFAGDCFESVDNCLGPSDAPFTVDQQSACYAVMRCFQKSNCLDGTGTAGKCYCGSLSLMACGAAPYDLTMTGAPDGVCAKELQAGFPKTYQTNSQVLGNLSAVASPSGAAAARLNCQKGANEQACLGACGFTTGGPAFP